jgi:hypothetical protein
MSLAANLAVQRNPFSTSAHAPKICDGSVPVSASERCQYSFTVALPNGECVLALTPSFSCPIIVRTQRLIQVDGTPYPANTAAAALIPRDITQVLMTSDEHCYELSPIAFGAPIAGPIDVMQATPMQNREGVVYHEGLWAVNLDPGTPAAGGNPAVLPTVGVDTATGETAPLVGTALSVRQCTRNAYSPDKFRIVSAGLRINAINNAEANNGWFEAIRINPGYEISECALFKKDNNRERWGIGVDHNKFANRVFAVGSNWANLPGYVTGKLRDIGKHMFYLQSTTVDRRFEDLEESFSTKSRSVDTSVICQLHNGPTASQGFDRSIDTILVRIHTTVTNAVVGDCMVHVHSVINYESTYDNSSPLARFQSSCISAESAVSAVDRAIKRDSKPSIIRQGSAGRYNPTN